MHGSQHVRTAACLDECCKESMVSTCTFTADVVLMNLIPQLVLLLPYVCHEFGNALQAPSALRAGYCAAFLHLDHDLLL
jgi:hypothetical protein